MEPSPKGDNISYIPFDPSSRATIFLAGFEYRLSDILCITPNNLPAAGVPELLLLLCDGLYDYLCILWPDAFDSLSYGIVEGNQEISHFVEAFLILTSAYRCIIPQNPFDDTGLAQSNVASNSQV